MNLRAPPHREPLRHCRAVVVGLEPWGAVAASDLVRAGIGALHLVDDGRVQPDDLLGTPRDPFQPTDLGAERRLALATGLGQVGTCRITSAPLGGAGDSWLPQGHAAWDLLIAGLTGDDLFTLSRVARFGHATRMASIAGHLDGLEAVVGPLVQPGHTACWNCARLRRLANAKAPRARHELEGLLLAQSPPRRARQTLPTMARFLGHALAAAALHALEASEASPVLSRVLIHHFAEASGRLHTVLPVPWCTVCHGEALGIPSADPPPGPPLDAVSSPTELRQRLAGVVDERTGIVRSIVVGSQDAEHSVELPITASALLGAYSPCALHGHGEEPEDGCGRGLTVVPAMVGAVAEALERYSARVAAEGALVRASALDLTGDRMLPQEICPYSDAQLDSPGFPFARVDAAASIDWVRGWWLHTGDPVLLPALPVFYDLHVPKAERFCQATSNGLAAGATVDSATAAACLELIERDAFMITWMTRRPATRVMLDGSISANVREVARRFEDQGAEVHLYLLQAGVDVPVALCVAFGDGNTWPGATVSLGCHLRPRVALEKAILEQGQGGPYIRRLMLEQRTPIPREPSAVQTLEDHALFYIPPERRAAFDFLAAGPTLAASDLCDPEIVSLSALASRVTSAGLRIAVVDVTSRDVRCTPFRVARAVGRGFQQIHFGHHLACLGNPRLLAMADRGLNPDPRPMA